MNSHKVCVIDVGTSSVRAAVVEGADEGDRIISSYQHPTPPVVPAPGLSEFDAQSMATSVLQGARQVISEVGAVDAVAVTNQRTSVVVWDRHSGMPIAPGLGWQDLRTVGDCLALQAEGIRITPNESATKLAHLLDLHDPERRQDLCFGTVDCWVVWNLSEGARHVTDTSNAAVTGLLQPDEVIWSSELLERLRIPVGCLPEIVDSTGAAGVASALPGAPPILGIIGDQQSSLVGQRCVLDGLGKITFGTGGMLNVCVGDERPAFAKRSEHGCFPVVAWQEAGNIVWAVEAMMLAAGSNVDWLLEDLQLWASAAECSEAAIAVEDTADVVYVPAPFGLGTPHWDFGARGALLGLTRGAGRGHIARAVLEGVAQRAADLLEAAEADSGRRLEHVRVDGGMSQSPVFTRMLADLLGRRVELCHVPEGTTLGAGVLARWALGEWGSWQEVAQSWTPREVLEPSVGDQERTERRERWHDAVQRASGWYPELSALDF